MDILDDRQLDILKFACQRRIAELKMTRRLSGLGEMGAPDAEVWIDSLEKSEDGIDADDDWSIALDALWDFAIWAGESKARSTATSAIRVLAEHLILDAEDTEIFALAWFHRAATVLDIVEAESIAAEMHQKAVESLMCDYDDLPQSHREIAKRIDGEALGDEEVLDRLAQLSRCEF